MLAQTYPKHLCTEKIWPLGKLYAVTQGASSTLRYAVLIPTVCPCVPGWQRFQQSQQAHTACTLPGSCRRCGPASSEKNLLSSFPHLALGAVFKSVLAWTALWLCLYLASYLVDPDAQAWCLDLSKSDVCPGACFIFAFVFFHCKLHQISVSHQLQVSALPLWNHSLKTGSVCSGIFCGHILFSLLETALFCSDHIAHDKHMLANNNQQP